MMQTIVDNELISEVLTMAAESDDEEGILDLYMGTPEISVSLSLEAHEWDRFVELIEKIDRSVDLDG